MYLYVLLGLTTVLCVSCAAQTKDENDAKWESSRKAMVAQLRDHYRIKDKGVLDAMAKVRRHVYIPESFRRRTNPYGDHPCVIGHGQTISQPYIVAYMTEHMTVKEEEKVLEIGTGSGYQAAVLAEMGADVYSIEIVPELAEHARKMLAAEGYDGVKVLAGDGYKGWPEHSPFDVVIVTCAPDKVPQALVDQLRDGGRMIVPVGTYFQRLVILKKTGGKIRKVENIAVRFVPMVRGKEEK